MTFDIAHLRVMPLHAITEIHGQAGLRRRLDDELDRLPAGDTVRTAADWAERLHADQRRVREPYANHLLRVCLRILCHYRVTDPDVLVAALLHDAVEDQPWAVAGVANHGPPPREAAFAAIAERYNARVARLVGAVTNPEPSPQDDPGPQAANRRYVTHLATALADEPWARVLKLSDFTDNGVGIVHTVGPKVPRAARKYTGALPVLRDLLERPDTPLPPAVRAHINRQLDLGAERFAAILAADADQPR
ncbi:hypothetical protein Val02_37170 [Virgisporangium aliadipatigenens]|uniref:HD domain-containing protein n=1 Tax=Virgisporangium aliadipatigenens TaxID=741659 RepID=A0A8J3YKF9_9ACTN|nr:HD domain-containing protein [Virgisporangium aliadipatigenens]GIJ46831.1 hypothetical protein Val02_37170 [Virgisporangium aliadipatigenens]